MFTDLIAVVLLVGMALGSIPLLLLFIDYRKRRQIHKPFIYLFVFFASWPLLFMYLLDSVGVWLALLAPLLVFAYVVAMRWAWKAGRRA